MAYHKGKPAPNRGIPHTDTTRKKISDSCKKAGVGKWNIGRPRTAETRKRMSEGTDNTLTPKVKEQRRLQGIRMKELHSSPRRYRY